MTAMTVDTVVKIVGSEKFVSSYDELNSSPCVGGNGNGNGDGGGGGALSGDHTENGVVNVTKLNAEDDKVNGDVEGDNLENCVIVDREDLAVENVVVKYANGVCQSDVEGEVDVCFGVSEISDLKPDMDELKNGSAQEHVLDLKSDENIGGVYMNGIASRFLDVDEKSKDIVSNSQISVAVDAPEFSEIEWQVYIAAMELAESELMAKHDTVTPLGNDIKEARSFDSDFKACLPTDADDKSLLLSDDVVFSVQSYDCQQQKISSADEDLIEAEARIDRQVGVESVTSEAIGCELNHAENGTITDQIGSDLPLELEETKEFRYRPTHSGHVGLELPAMGISDSLSVGQFDETATESTFGDESNSDVLTTDTQLDTTDKYVVLCELQGFDGDGKSEMMAETRGTYEVLTEVGVLQDQVAEVDTEISSEDCIPEKASTVEDTTSLSKLQSAEVSAADGSHVRDCVSENIVVSVSDDTAEDAESSERCGHIYLGLHRMELPNPRNSGISNEWCAADVVSSVANYNGGSGAADTCSLTDLENIYDSKTQTANSEIGTTTNSNDVFDASWWPTIRFGSLEFEPSFSPDNIMFQSEISAATNANDIFDASWWPTIRFGSLEFEPPFSPNNIKLQSDALKNKSTAISTSTSVDKLCPENDVSPFDYRAASDLNGWLEQNVARAEVVSSEQTVEVPASSAQGSDADSSTCAQIVCSEQIVEVSASSVQTSEADSSACAQIVCSQQTVEVSASSVQGSEADSSEEQQKNPDMEKKSFWLVKVPKGDVGGYGEKLRQSERDLAEKTETRNALKADLNKQQTYRHELRNSVEAARSEARAAQELVRAKKKELDSAHLLVMLAKNGVTVDDLDKKIRNLEHILQHETHSLREERELVREIRQLTLQRQESAANPQLQKEIQQARDQRDHAMEQLKVLKKELDALRDNFVKAEERVRAAQKKHDDEIGLLIDLKQRVRSANDIRQEAYVRTMTLRTELREKNAIFYNAKRVAYNYAASGKKDELERHCANQVATFMEMWNRDDEFRRAYIQCNQRHMLWKFGTLDGTQRGINEAPPSLTDISDDRVDASIEVDSSKPLSITEIDRPVESHGMEDKPSTKEEQKKVTPIAEKNEAVSKSLAEVSSKTETTEDDNVEPKLTKEEEEAARKAEQVRREEEAARLREKQIMEDKDKAEEALERKRRNAMKAQARAELKAQKETEQKEKEREKRAKKRAKKKGLNPEIITDDEPAQTSEPLSESVKKSEVTEKPAIVAKRPRKASLPTKQVKTIKPIPPLLRNKGKRGFLHYQSTACIVFLTMVLFFLGSFERIHTIKHNISGLLSR